MLLSDPLPLERRKLNDGFGAVTEVGFGHTSVVLSLRDTPSDARPACRDRAPSTSANALIRAHDQLADIVRRRDVRCRGTVTLEELFCRREGVGVFGNRDALATAGAPAAVRGDAQVSARDRVAIGFPTGSWLRR